MNNNKKRIALALYAFSFFIICIISNNTFAQLITNGGFENSNLGDITTTGTKGWFIQVASGSSTFEIVNDVVEEGSHALKVTVQDIGTNPWDIQAVVDSIPVTQNGVYEISLWAKSKNPGQTINLTAGNYSFAQYDSKSITVNQVWRKFSFQFTVTDNQKFVRAPLHFSYAANKGNSIYIDNVQVIDINETRKPVVVEAESGKLGSNFSILKEDTTNYVTAKTTYSGQTGPGDSSRAITYQVTFKDAGYYNLFARLRVGSGAFNDDSFFYGRGFGEKNDTLATDWVFINGLASAGFTVPTDLVNDIGAAGSQVWKWVNLTEISYSGSPVDSFYVSADSLTKTFQIGSREDGLDIDKIAFGKTNLFYTVNELDNNLPGTTTSPVVDSSLYWKGPALATGSPKFLGSAGDSPDNNFIKYWTQITPENAGKWASVGSSQDTTLWNWNGLDKVSNYAKTNNLVFKDHTLIWGSQQPSWISSLDSAKQALYIETWIRKVGQRYPNIDMIDVVNECLNGHNPPDGLNGRANYKKALGGNGTTGWDWVIKSFELARKYLPNAKLLLNDYGIINNNDATTSYLYIINLLKDRGLIDGIGEQGHGFENIPAATIKSNLDRLAATGLPIYITEFDLSIQNDAQQKSKYQELFPVMWQHPAVKGVTLWGYIQGRTWVPYSYLVNTNGTARPALLWLAQYVKDNPVGVNETTSAIPTNYKLEQNYPNPFNPTTNIRYSLTNTTKVILKVYDVLGREVQTLVNSVQAPGQYIVTFNAKGLSSGIYFYRLSTENFSATKKLLLLK